MTRQFTNAYATDGKCHNANTGSYNHECDKPATWIGINRKGWACGFCDSCKKHGSEGSLMVEWVKRDPAAALHTALDAHFAR